MGSLATILRLCLELAGIGLLGAGSLFFLPFVALDEIISGLGDVLLEISPALLGLWLNGVVA
jgi:hypothetical protein